MNAIAVNTMQKKSAGLWLLAWRKLIQDRVAVVSGIIVALFLLMIMASSLGLIAKDWNKEVGVSYANPVFLAGQENLEADATRKLQASNKETQVIADLSDIDPLAPRYKEWEELAKKYSQVETPRSDTLPFGGDKWGHDVIKKAIKGAEVSILVGLIASFFAVVIGTILGALSGYYGGKMGDFLEWVYNVFTSVPYILLVLTFAAVLAKYKGLPSVVAILALTGWTGIYRLIRAEYIKHRAREYVRAAEAIGASHMRRMFKHILPNVSHVILVQLSQHVVQFIKAEVILSFLGFGVPVDMVSWGTMLAEAQNELVIGKWWQLAAAGLSMAALVTAFSLFTDALRDALDPKLK